MILGIDTAGAVASVALVKGGAALAERMHPDRDSRPSRSPFFSPKGNHAEVLLPLIQELREESGWSLERLTGIALSIGPGSFTGLRIGLATAKGIAYEWGVPVAGVSTLHAHAARIKNFNGVVCALLDARKREVYTALFRSAGCRLERLAEDQLTSIQNALARARSLADEGGAFGFVGDGARAYEKVIEREFGGGAVFFDKGSVAAAAACLAEERLSAGLSDDIGALAPVYLRSSEAETKLVKSHLTC